MHTLKKAIQRAIWVVIKEKLSPSESGREAVGITTHTFSIGDVVSTGTVAFTGTINALNNNKKTQLKSVIITMFFNFYAPFCNKYMFILLV